MIIQIGQSGLNTDVAPSKLPPDAVTGGDNFLCVEGSVRSPTMRLKAFDISIEPVYHFVWTNADNEDKVVVSDGETVLLYDTDGTEHDITPDDGADPPVKEPFTAGSQVTFCDLGTLLIVNSNQDGPFYYDPDTEVLVDLPGWNPLWRCEVMASVRYNLVALNMTEDDEPFPQKIRWSNSAQDGAIPTDWTPALSNDAGDEILGETGGHIIGAVLFRGSLWIGKTDSLYEMRYLGGQYVYSVTRRTGDIGISNHRALTAAKNVMLVQSRDDVYRFDGSNAQSLSDNRVHNQLIEYSDNGSFEYAEITYSPNQDYAVVLAVGTGRAADQSMVYALGDNTWNTISFGAVYGFDLAALTADTDPELLCYRKVGDAYQVERFTNVYDPALEGEYEFITGNVERTSIPLEGVSMVEKVLPLLRGVEAVPLRIQIGVQASQSAPIRWTPEYAINPESKTFIPVRKVGRFLSWRATARARQPWYLDALDVRTRPAGDKD